MIFQGLSRTRTWHFFLIFNVIFKLSSIMNGNIAKVTNRLIGRACKCVFSPLSYFLQDMKMTFSQLFMTTQAFSWDFPLSLDQTQEVGQGKTTFCVVSKPTFCKSNVEIVQDGLVTVLMWLAVTSPKERKNGENPSIRKLFYRLLKLVQSEVYCSKDRLSF